MKLAIAMLAKEDALHDAPGASHAPREIQVAVVVWEGLTNREIDRFIGTSEEVMKIQLRSTFDKPGVCRRLELAMDVASDGGKSWKVKPGAPPRVLICGSRRLGVFRHGDFFTARTLRQNRCLRKPDSGGPLRGLGFLRASAW